MKYPGFTSKLELVQACLIAGFIFLLHQNLFSQNQVRADSLEAQYLKGGYEGEEELEILRMIAQDAPNPDISLKYSNELLQKATILGSEKYRYTGYLFVGNALTLKGDLSQALEAYFRGVQIATDGSQKDELGEIYVAIAGVYSAMGNRANTIHYYTSAMKILKEAGDSLNYAKAVENLGDEYNLNFSNPDSALVFFRESGAIFSALDYKLGIAYNLGNIGLAYAQLGNNDIAEEHIGKATEILTGLGDFYPISVYLTYMSDMYAAREDWDAAFSYALRSLKLARQYGLKEQIGDAYLKLSELYETTGQTAAALKYYRNYIAFRDSVKNITSVQEMADMRTNYEVAQKQVEVDLLNQQKKTQKVIVIAVVTALFLIGLLAFGLYRRNRFIKATNEIIEAEMDRSDALLKNILPEATAQELKISGKVTAKYFESASVLFTDFKAFTKYSENLPPQELVNTVNFYFSNFDTIIQKYGLEKIKTIGDAYMCAGGLPFPDDNHARNTVLAALEILDFVEAAKNEQTGTGAAAFDIRIGINSGSVVAGVVGTRKFAYDIWGDTVNIAARMESNSEPGKINISEATYELVREEFRCKYRGNVEVKNKGMMKMYFVAGPQVHNAV